MKRDRSHLSRDEVVLLLSEREKQAEEHYAPLLKELKLLKLILANSPVHIYRCAFPGCDAASVIQPDAEEYDGETYYINCQFVASCITCWKDYLFYCDKHHAQHMTPITTLCERHWHFENVHCVMCLCKTCKHDCNCTAE